MCHPVTADVLEYGVLILSHNLRLPLMAAVPLLVCAVGYV
jgi:hypothetical protein